MGFWSEVGGCGWNQLWVDLPQQQPSCHLLADFAGLSAGTTSRERNKAELRQLIEVVGLCVKL